jgi:hypothetical protein
VSAERSSWIVFDCPACGKSVKMPEAARGTRKPCPVCGELISAGRIEGQGTFLHGLPPERHVAPPPRLRPPGEENWHAGPPEKKGRQFHSALGRIGEDVALRSEEDLAQREQRRAKIREQAMTASAPAWDQAAAKPRRRRRRRARAWVVGIAATAAAAGFLVAVVLLLARPGTGASPVEPISPGTVAGEAAGGSAAAAALTDAEYAEMRQVVEGFVTAVSPEERLRWVRDSDRVARALSEHFRDHPSAPARLVSFSPRLEIVSAGGLFCGFAELSDYTSRFVAVERTAAGRFLVDWEAYVGWCEVPWEVLSLERPARPVLLRARLRSDTYFNGRFNDPEEWACFRLSPLDNSTSIYGYVRLSDPLFAALSTKTKFNRLVLGVLRVRFPEKATAPNQVEITEWVCDGWVLRTPPAPAPPQ